MCYFSGTPLSTLGGDNYVQRGGTLASTPKSLLTGRVMPRVAVKDFEETTMSDKSASKPAPDNVVPLRKSKAVKLQSEAKWGAEVMDQGHCIVPSLVFRAQRRLGLSGMQLAVLLQLASFWWENDKLPFPKKGTLAERLNVSEKQIQRIVKELEQAGLVARHTRKNHRGQQSNFYDLSGLVAKLKELAPEFARAKDASRKVEQRGGLRGKRA